MERELIIKALECCGSDVYVCQQCPIDEKIKDDCECGKLVARNALALITSQEQRIKELDEKSKKWEQAYDCMHSACLELSSKCDRLTEENKAWQKQLISTEEQVGKAYYELACEVEDLRKENENLHASCTELTQSCTKLTEENERLRKNLETFKGKQKSLQKQIEVLSKENHLLLSKDFDVTIGDCHIVFSNGKKGNIYTFTEKDQIAKEMLEGKDEKG